MPSATSPTTCILRVLWNTSRKPVFILAIQPFASALLLPDSILGELSRQTAKLARGLGVVGLMNVQYAIKDGTVYILEVNPRASRTVPFVAKATGVPIARSRPAGGEKLVDLLKTYPAETTGDHVAVKEAVFPFAKFPGVDIILGPEMKSTGEVMGIDSDFGLAFAKSQLGSGTSVPQDGTVFISVRDRDKDAMIDLGRRLKDMGFSLVATGGTAETLNAAGVETELVKKVHEGRPHIVDSMISGNVQLVFNTTEGAKAIATPTKPPVRSGAENTLLYYRCRRESRCGSYFGDACRWT